MKNTHILLLIFSICLYSRYGLGQDRLNIFNNFATDWRSAWEQKSFSRQESILKVVEENGDKALKVSSDDAATGIWKELDFKVEPNSTISWRWKTKNIIENPEEMRKRGDDHVGRIYVIFGKYAVLAQFRVKVICYVWASEKPVGTVFDSPYASNVKLMVLENKESKTGQWLLENRNLYEDYKQIFGKEPPVISGIGILADTDNTGTSAVTWFDDLELSTEVEGRK